MPGEEKVFYQSGDVIVSSTRLVVPAQTFAIASVSSVKHAAIRSSLIPSVSVIVLGLLFAVTGSLGKNDASFAFGLMLIGAAGWMLSRRKTDHHVVLVTGRKEIRVLSNSNRRLIESVIDAVNEAIEFRENRVGRNFRSAA